MLVSSVVSDSLRLQDYSLPGSSVHGILRTRSGLPFPSPGNLPSPGIEPRSPALQADSLPSEPPLSPFRFTNSASSFLSQDRKTC